MTVSPQQQRAMRQRPDTISITLGMTAAYDRLENLRKLCSDADIKAISTILRAIADAYAAKPKVVVEMMREILFIARDANEKFDKREPVLKHPKRKNNHKENKS